MTKMQFSLKTFSYRDLMAHLRTPLYRNGYALILSTGITSVLGLLYWAVAAKFYSTENVGLNSAVISIMIFLSGISQVNLQETMVRYIPIAGRRTPRMVIYTYSLVLALSAIVGLVFYVGIPIWAPSLNFLTQSPLLAGWFVFTVCVWGIFVIQDSVMTGLRQALWIPAENAAFSIIKILLLIGLATLIPASGIFVSWTLSVFLIIIPINILIFKRLIPRHITTIQTTEDSAIPLRQISRFVAGNYAAALFSNMASTLLPLIITQSEGAEANAHFFLGWTIANALQIMTTNMATSLTVEASLDKSNEESYRRRAMIGIYRLVLPAAILLIFASPIILRLVGQSYVADGTPLMQLLALAAIPNVYNSVYISMARTNNRNRSVVAVYGANAILVLGLSHFFLPLYGVAAVGLAWLISQSLIALTIMAMNRLKARNVVPALAVEAEQGVQS